MDTKVSEKSIAMRRRSRRTFLARHISPDSSAPFLRFSVVRRGSEGGEKVRSTSHADTSTSFPASANVVEEILLEASEVRGDGTSRSSGGASGDV